MIAVNLLQPKGSLRFSGYLLSDVLPQGPTQSGERSFFPQNIFSPRAALYLVTCSEFVKDHEPASATAPFCGSMPAPPELIPLVRVLDSRRAESWGVLEYLAKAEGQESDVWLRDDIRIAWMCVLYAAQDFADAWGYAFWSFFGKTYPKALLAWAERDEVNRRALERCAALVRAERQAREGSPLCGESAEKLAPSLPRGASLGLAHPVPVVSPIGGEAAGKQEVPKPHGNLYDSCREFLASLPSDRERAA